MADWYLRQPHKAQVEMVKSACELSAILVCLSQTICVLDTFSEIQDERWVEYRLPRITLGKLLQTTLEILIIVREHTCTNPHILLLELSTSVVRNHSSPRSLL